MAVLLTRPDVIAAEVSEQKAPTAEDSNALSIGIVAEEADLDAGAALKAYRQVIDRYDAQRREVAQAVFRLGEILRKQGATVEAQAQYQRLVREFADQAELSAQGRQRLAEIQRPRSVPSGRYGAAGRYGPRMPGVGSPGNSGGGYGPTANSDGRHFVNPRWLLNVAFGSSLAKQGAAAVGNTPSDFWNGYYLPWVNVVPLLNLQSWNREITPVSLEVRNAAGAWANHTGDAMYDSYVYVNDNSGNNVVVTITNLPAGRYDFYLYGHADPTESGQEANSLFKVESAGQSFGPTGTTKSAGWKATENVAASSVDPALAARYGLAVATRSAASAWQEGKQYVRFTGVEVKEGGLVVVTAMPGQDGKPIDGRARPAVINGMQIVRVEEGAEDTVGPPPMLVVPADSAVSSQAEAPRLPGAVSARPASRVDTEIDRLQAELQRTEELMRTKAMSDAMKELQAAEVAYREAMDEGSRAGDAFAAAQLSKDHPERLAEPAASDPSFQRLKAQLVEAMVQPGKERDKAISDAQAAMRTWMETIYLPGLEAAVRTAEMRLQRADSRVQQCRARLDAAQDSLKKKLNELQAQAKAERAEEKQQQVAVPNSLAALKAKLAALRVDFSDEHPEVIKLRREIEVLEELTRPRQR